MTSSPIARAIAELETERENLVARLAKVDAGIATMRDLFHLPANGQPRKARTGPPRELISRGPASEAEPTRKADKLKDRIRAALTKGPMTPGDLATKLGIERPALRYQVKQLEDAGELVSTGTTADRQIALTGTPAKEAP
jgi:DNA-binding transcriptional ArsR family regulator